MFYKATKNNVQDDRPDLDLLDHDWFKNRLNFGKYQKNTTCNFYAFTPLTFILLTINHLAVMGVYDVNFVSVIYNSNAIREGWTESQRKTEIEEHHNKT